MTDPSDDNLHDAVADSQGTELFGKVMRNGATIAIARLLAAVTAIAIVPVIIHQLGLAGYGVWETLFAVTSLVTMTLGALGTTFLWKISQIDASGNVPEAVRLVGVAVFLVLAIATAVGILLVLLTPVFISCFQLGGEEAAGARQILPLLIVVCLLGGLNAVRAAGLQAFHKAGLVSFVNTFSQLANYLLTAVLLFRGVGLWSLFWGFLVATVATYSLHTILLYRTFGKLCVLPILPDWHELRGMVKYFGMLLVGTGAVALRGQTDRLILAAFASTTWVGFYGIAARLVSPIMEISNFVYTPVIAAAGNLSSSGNWKALGNLYSRMMGVVPFVAGLVAVLLVGLQREIQIIWLGEYIPEVRSILLWLLLGQGAAVILTGPGTAILKGAGRLRIETAYIVLNLILNLICTVVLVLMIGPIGTVVSSGLTWALASLLFLFLLHKYTQLPFRATLNGLLVLAAVIVFCLSMPFIPPLFACDTRIQCIHHAIIFGGILSLLFAGACYCVRTSVLRKTLA